MSRKLIVEIVGDSSSLEKAFKRSERSAQKFQRTMTKTDNVMTRKRRLPGGGARLGGGIGIRGGAGLLASVGVTAELKRSVSAASDLEQQIGKTNVVFGKSGAAVNDWAKTLANSFGLSTREALTFASTFGSLFQPLGIVGDQAAKQSEKLTELGADLASFYNTNVADALAAIRSGIVGEAEPLRSYGVLLSETRVQQEALVETGKKNVSNLTDQEKVLARITLIYKDSKVAQGDFARTSDQAAQQMKILQANVANLEAELGATLLPTLNKVVTALNEFFVAASGGAAEGSVKGQGVETTLVPLISKRIDAAKKAGQSGKEILANLRKWLGDSQKANDLIAEGFLFSRNAKLRARLRAQAKAAKEGDVAAATGGGGPDKAARARLRRAAEAFRELRRARRVRLRQAAEAARTAVEDRAAFNVEKTGATKTLKDDLAALRRYNALLTRRIKGGHGTLDLEREQFHVQMQIADVLKQQADLAKKTKKRLGVDVTRFQKTARGQFVLAGAAGGGRGVVISGGVHLHGIQNVSQLENELQRRAKQRSQPRRRR